MKRILMTLTVLAVGLSVTVFSIENHSAAAQNTGTSVRAQKRQQKHQQWENEMAAFRQRSEKDRQLEGIVDSLSSVQANASVRNRDFVLEAESVSFRNGTRILVNSITNFVSLKGDRAVVQLTSDSAVSGPNGIGGVTVNGNASDLEITTDRKGGTRMTMNVTGIGISAQVEIYIYPESNRATATIYPNFNSNTVWLQGKIVPYDNSKVYEGRSL